MYVCKFGCIILLSIGTRISFLISHMSYYMRYYIIIIIMSRRQRGYKSWLSFDGCFYSHL